MFHANGLLDADIDDVAELLQEDDEEGEKKAVVIEGVSHGGNGNTALMEALSWKTTTVEIVEFLVDTCCQDVHARNRFGHTVFHALVACDRTAERSRLIDRMAAYGADVTLADYVGTTPAHLAVRAGDAEALDRFLALAAASGAADEYFRAVDAFGETLVQNAFYAHTLRRVEVVRCLIRAAAQCDLNQVGFDGNAMIHLAILQNDDALFELLCEHPASVDLTASNGTHMSIHLILLNGRGRMLSTLLITRPDRVQRRQMFELQCSRGIPAWQYALRYSNIECLQFLHVSGVLDFATLRSADGHGAEALFVGNIVTAKCAALHTLMVTTPEEAATAATAKAHRRGDGDGDGDDDDDDDTKF